MELSIGNGLKLFRPQRVWNPDEGAGVTSGSLRLGAGKEIILMITQRTVNVKTLGIQVSSSSVARRICRPEGRPLISKRTPLRI